MTERSPGIEEQRAIFREFAEFARAKSAGGVRHGETRITGEGDSRRVMLLFSHDDFPDARFGYRCKPPGDDRCEEIWLAEEVATGALHQMMRYDRPTPDAEGIIWTRLYGQLLGDTDESVRPKLVLRAFAHVAATDAGATCGIYVPHRNQPRACRGVAIARVSGHAFDRAVVDEDGHPLHQWSARYVGACRDHVEELRRRAERGGGQVQMLG